MLQLLAGAGASLAARSDAGATILCSAAAAGQSECVEWLVQQGVPIEMPDTRGWTPLFFACSTAQENVVRLLLSLRADPIKTDEQQRTAGAVADAAFRHFENKMSDWRTVNERDLCSTRMKQCINISSILQNVL